MVDHTRSCENCGEEITEIDGDVQMAVAEGHEEEVIIRTHSGENGFFEEDVYCSKDCFCADH